MKHRLFLLLMLLLPVFYVFAQTDTTEVSTDPLYFVDDIAVNKGVVSLYKPEEIAAVQVYKDSTATRLYGEEGINGAICLVTKKFAKEHYWDFFRSKSIDYTRAVPSYTKDEQVVYVLNDTVLFKDYEAALYFINESNFINIQVIEHELLQKKFNISDKNWGIIINTKR